MGAFDFNNLAKNGFLGIGGMIGAHNNWFGLGGGGQQGYGALPFENPNFEVDYNRVSQALEQGLGRTPTKNEIDQYSKYIKSGDLSYGDITNIANGLPEADRARLDVYAKQYGDKLNEQNGAILDQAASATNSNFAKMGRPNSSAMYAQVAQAGGQLAQQRQSALAAFYGGGLQNNMAQYNQLGQNTVNRGNALGDERTAYNRSLLGYQTQRNDYGTDLYNQNQQNRQRAMYQFGGSLIGAGLGSFGGPGGAYVGSQLGGQAGGLFGGR